MQIRFAKFTAPVDGVELVLTHDNGAQVRASLKRLERWLLRLFREDFGPKG